ncbi:hypothetical protein [Methylobacterium sp. E-046]|uniref:hypothetical protein n=1 Tax=Methylobacterium sp. E-046 TaxID=2836576 RepID=UPI001FB8CDB5|nr:hypothetical protein [Methylobacterium sp. E-046]MCJ2102758.1 hypothetical protein [Methylobacterium sp. E-046]
MSALIPYGTFPTPYGVTIPAFHPGGDTAGEPDHFLFDMDGTAIFAGIHSKAERKRFAEDATRLGYAPRFEDYGGHPIPKMPLRKPRDPAYPRVAGLEGDVPIEAWTTGLLDRFQWCDRAEFLIGIIGQNLERATWSRHEFMAEVYPLGLSIMLTAALERFRFELNRTVGVHARLLG